jgi:hypothetical protein
MAKQKFTHFVPRPKPRKRPVVIKKDLTKMKKEVIRDIINKEEYDKNSNNKW